ncbi:protein of unknown function [Pseudodesulfovibrio profundus]|uniref:Uncharacterized protein n=1 Tax=Pseudodesulfovibrio profundus TaxID=57320 RepID=A0A2C8FDE7_9BACT|nr:hypothetical protein [Pseudodesulfovibrio profundus]SOB60560.1 protein of unknown function [Pseudodesulfovibrio profundus]
MSAYELNPKQKSWLHDSPDKDDLLRFLINGPVDTVSVIEGLDLKVAGRLRGVRVTKPVRSMALALKEAEQIRNEYIQAVGMIPLDEETLGINDNPKQKVTA